MGQAKRRGTLDERIDKARTVITRGYMLKGPDKEAGTDDDGSVWLGWRVHAEPRSDRFPVTIVKGHK